VGFLKGIRQESVKANQIGGSDSSDVEFPIAVVAFTMAIFPGLISYEVVIYACNDPDRGLDSCHAWRRLWLSQR